MGSSVKLSLQSWDSQVQARSPQVQARSTLQQSPVRTQLLRASAQGDSALLKEPIVHEMPMCLPGVPFIIPRALWHGGRQTRTCEGNMDRLCENCKSVQYFNTVQNTESMLNMQSRRHELTWFCSNTGNLNTERQRSERTWPSANQNCLPWPPYKMFSPCICSVSYWLGIPFHCVCAKHSPQFNGHYKCHIFFML